MKQTGFIFLMYPLENASDGILSRIDKGTEQKTKCEVLEKSHKAET